MSVSPKGGAGGSRLDDSLHLIAVLRAEPEQPSGVDALEAYLRYAPA